jgi:tetratricopeptide (TPR) repeat protein
MHRQFIGTMRPGIRAVFLAGALMLTCLLAAQEGPRPHAGNIEAAFLRLKNQGRYDEALEALAAWTLNLDDVPAIETNLLRMHELITHPELCSRALELTALLDASPVIRENPLLRARLHQASLVLNLKKGNLARADALKKKLGYLDGSLIGPFDASGRDSFDKDHGPGLADAERTEHRGRHCALSWFDAEPDRLGVIDAADLFHSVKDSAFYFRRAFDIDRDGRYEILLGKCGYTDLSLNGRVIYSSRKRHGFFHDQYRISLYLNRGRHLLILKTADSPQGLSFSLRMTGPSGEALLPSRPAAGPGVPFAESRVLGAGLNTTIDLAAEDESLAFRRGFWHHITGLSSLEERESRSLFESISEGSHPHSSALHYAGKGETDDERAESFHRRARDADIANLESCYELALLKLKRSLYYEAYPLIDAMQTGRPAGPLYLEALARYCLARKWEAPARQHIAALQSSKLSSRGHALALEMDIGDRNYLRALDHLGELQRHDSYDPRHWHRLYRLLMLGGRSRDAEDALHRAMAVHPSRVTFRAMLGSSLVDSGNPGGALPVLAAALHKAPYHRDTLAAMADAYLALGLHDKAAHYARRALLIDPENTALRLRLAVMQNGDDRSSRYRWRGDLSALVEKAAPYAHEPAVQLLDESITNLNGDGSSDMHVRTVFQINDDAVAEHFSYRHIVFAPEREKVENVSCVVHDGMLSREVTERYLKSLSDPESRLYYDLSSLIVPVPLLRKGSLLDFSYTVKSRRDETGGAFGRMALMGGRRRTMASNHVIIAPKSLKLYYGLRGSAGDAMRVEERPAYRTYRIQADNIPPRPDESAIPDESSFLPGALFTSFASWDDLVDWYRTLVAGRIVVSAEMRKAVESLTAAAASNEEKASRIYHHVVAQVRYAGFEMGVGGIRPRRTDQTYASRVGDCKDMSLLLVAMLREAGIRADLALVRTADMGPYERSVPHLGFFNHALCAVDLDGPLFLDATAEFTGFRELPEIDRGILALVVSEADHRFVEVEGSRYAPNVVTAENKIVLDEQGGARIERRLRKEGTTAPSMRSGMGDPGKNQRSLSAYWNGRHAGALVSGLDIIASDIEEPAEYAYTVSLPALCDRAGDDLVFRPYLTTSDYFSNYALARNRRLPLLLPAPATTSIRNRYAVPPGFRPHQLPRNERFSDPDFEAAFTFEIDGGDIIAASWIVTRTSRIEAHQYPRFREFSRFVNRKERERIVLVRERAAVEKTDQR